MKKRILILNTLDTKEVVNEISSLLQGKDVEPVIFNTEGMRISPCLGCNDCWLKNPRTCSIKDDYEPILKELTKADQLWIIADTNFGFLSYKAKNVIDRIMPMLTMYLHFVDGKMRHILRYDKRTDAGIIYRGEADAEFLLEWEKRFTSNIDSRALGVFTINQTKEAVSCML